MSNISKEDEWNILVNEPRTSYTEGVRIGKIQWDERVRITERWCRIERLLKEDSIWNIRKSTEEVKKPRGLKRVLLSWKKFFSFKATHAVYYPSRNFFCQ